MQSVSGNFNVLLKNFCEKREYIRSKTRNYAKKCFWWWGYVQETKLLLYFRIENHGYVTKTCSALPARPGKLNFTSLIKWGWRWEVTCWSILRGKEEEMVFSCRKYGRSVLLELLGLIWFLVAEQQHFHLGHMGVLSDHQLILYFCSAWSSLHNLYFENYRVFFIGVMSFSIYRHYVLILIYRCYVWVSMCQINSNNWNFEILVCSFC